MDDEEIDRLIRELDRAGVLDVTGDKVGISYGFHRNVRRAMELLESRGIKDNVLTGAVMLSLAEWFGPIEESKLEKYTRIVLGTYLAILED